MAFKYIFVVFFALVIVDNAVGLGKCLDSARITSCSPKCTDDSNCLGAKVCCTNVCGTKSCSDMNQYLHDKNGSNDKYSNNKGATGSYCGNTKCSSGEKCELDRTTKRQKCVRA